MNLRLHLGDCERTFDMEKAVCNHGFFMMAPNVWNPTNKSLHRPLRLSDSSSVNVSISHPSNLRFLVVQVHGINNVSRVDEQLILKQVARMLRISDKDEEDMKSFHQVHEVAKDRGFGRLFRSPCLFEDIIKSILLCNCTWARTLDMATRLCKMQTKIAQGLIRPMASPLKTCRKRKKGLIPQRKHNKTDRVKQDRSLCDDGRVGNFPSAEELANLDEDFLNEHCNLGYRVKYVQIIARKVENGNLNLKKIENSRFDSISCKEMVKRLVKIKGLGAFATATLLMCLGFYSVVPSDTETIRHLKEVHGMEDCTKKTVERDAEEIYSKYSPFQSLAYWLELVEDYERKFGKLGELNPTSYSAISGSFHFKHGRSK